MCNAIYHRGIVYTEDSWRQKATPFYRIAFLYQKLEGMIKARNSDFLSRKMIKQNLGECQLHNHFLFKKKKGFLKQNVKNPNWYNAHTPLTHIHTHINFEYLYSLIFHHCILRSYHKINRKMCKTLAQPQIVGLNERLRKQ